MDKIRNNNLTIKKFEIIKQGAISMYLQQQTDEEIQNVQPMLETNPQITQLMHEIQKRQEQYDLLDFVKRQRMIMNQELILDKIPFVKSNIHKFNTNISEKVRQIEEMKNKIIEIKDKAQRKKRRNQQLYNKKRALTNECKTIENQIYKLNSKNKEGSRRNNSSLVVQSSVEDGKHEDQRNKQNQNQQNQMSSQNNHVNASHLQVLDLVNLRTKNILLLQQIQKTKQQVQKKMQQALVLERECKGVHILSSKSSVSRNKSTNRHCGVGRSGSVTKSEFISIEQSDNSSLRA